MATINPYNSSLLQLVKTICVGAVEANVEGDGSCCVRAPSFGIGRAADAGTNQAVLRSRNLMVSILNVAEQSFGPEKGETDTAATKRRENSRECLYNQFDLGTIHDRRNAQAALLKPGVLKTEA